MKRLLILPLVAVGLMASTTTTLPPQEPCSEPNAIKIDPPVDGTYGAFTLTFSAIPPDGSVTVTGPGITGVSVKGGSAQNGGGYMNYPSGGSGLTAPLNPQSGKYFAISHVIICYEEETSSTTTSTSSTTSTTSSSSTTSTTEPTTTTMPVTTQPTTTTLGTTTEATTTTQPSSVPSSTVQPSTPTTIGTVPPSTLPHTGLSSVNFGVIGVVSLLLGSLAVLAVRQKG